MSLFITCAERRYIVHNAGSRRFLVNTIYAQLLNISRSQFTKQANSYQTRLQPLTLCGRLAAFTKHCVAQVAYKRSRCHFLTVCLSVYLCVCVFVCGPDRQHVRNSNIRRQFTSAEYQPPAHLASQPHRTPVINIYTQQRNVHWMVSETTRCSITLLHWQRSERRTCHNIALTNDRRTQR